MQPPMTMMSWFISQAVDLIRQILLRGSMITPRNADLEV
jgi:hypothetical protein